jgi:hypothetical protein
MAWRMAGDVAALLQLPPAPCDACHKVSTRVSSLSLALYRNNDDSAPTRHGYQEVLAKGYVDRVIRAAATRRSSSLARLENRPARLDLTFYS